MSSLSFQQIFGIFLQLKRKIKNLELFTTSINANLAKQI